MIKKQGKYPPMDYSNVKKTYECSSQQINKLNEKNDDIYQTRYQSEMFSILYN